MIVEKIIQGPVVTEKSVASQEEGIYTFWVHPDATKVDVKLAFHVLYNRDVKSVKISSLPKKTRLVGRGKTMTKRQEKRKAFVRFSENKPFEILSVEGVKKSAKKPAVKKTTTKK